MSFFNKIMKLVLLNRMKFTWEMFIQLIISVLIISGIKWSIKNHRKNVVIAKDDICCLKAEW